MKKILFILPSLCIGGLERMQVTLANALSKAGYQVSVMILDADDTLKTELDSSVQVIHKGYKTHFGQKIPYIRHKFYDDGMWETRATPEQLYQYYIGDEQYDIEIAFFRGLSVKIVSGGVPQNHTDFGKTVNREQIQKKRIAWVHTDFRRASGYANNFRSIQEVSDAYAKFDHVVCVSNEAQSGYKEIIGNTGNLTTIYNMLPVESIKAKAAEVPAVTVPKKKFHLVLVGRLLDSVKGQNRLINVVTRLNNEGRKISLSLVGGGGDEQKLKKQIAENRAEAYITMCGSQMNPYPFIKEADLLVCASFFEGYNLTVAEALILGVPVLSTCCTGPTEILDNGKYGILVENSEEGLYNGIKRLYDNTHLLRDAKEKADERSIFFDEKQIMSMIEEILQ